MLALYAGTFHINSSLAYTVGALSLSMAFLSFLMGEDLYPDLIESPMATRIFLSATLPPGSQLIFNTTISVVTTMEEQVFRHHGAEP